MSSALLVCVVVMITTSDHCWLTKHLYVLLQERNTYNINENLKACTSVAQLQQLVQDDGTAMSYVNLTTAIVRLQKILSRYTSQQQQQVTRTADSLFSLLWQLQQPKLPQCGARELSNMIYSVCLLPKPLQQQY